MYHAVMIKYLYKSTERIFEMNPAKIFQLKNSTVCCLFEQRPLNFLFIEVSHQTPLEKATN